MSDIVKPERPGGFLDFLPADCLARERMLRTIEKVFRSFGFDPIETPAIEFYKTLAGEGGDVGKQIFHVGCTKQEEDDALALRFDQTVPFARLLAANPFDPKKRTGIRLPWRRMVVGPVFRGERPQSGRYRQFCQFDADIAGTESMLADAEIIAMMYRTMKALGIERFLIRINNRKILNGLAELVGISDGIEISSVDITKELMRILDKLDKIGIDRVLQELGKEPHDSFDPAPHLSSDGIDKIKAYLAISGSNPAKLDQCQRVFSGIKVAEEGLEELRQITDYLAAMEIPVEHVQIDLSIARGLDYYTGPVMETILLDAPHIGSVFSGGRYNSLVSRFTGQELPAVGASIGVDRLFTALDHLKAIDRSQQTVTEVMILQLVPHREGDYLAIANELRVLGLNTEICLLDDTTFKGQFNFAISRGVNFVIICGSDEFEKQSVQIKNLKTRVQTEVSRKNLAEYFGQDNR
ncbi:MAG: histidine--tRNA ligase [Deltaproteobacteria bacterium]|nr:histidine--tRNA ligase [Deltaproteobacteria bacterium]